LVDTVRESGRVTTIDTLKKENSDMTTTAAKTNSSKASKAKAKGSHKKPEGLVRVAAGSYTITLNEGSDNELLYGIEQREGGKWHATRIVGDEISDVFPVTDEFTGYSSRGDAYEAVMSL
jgi:hypothetical protein